MRLEGQTEIAAARARVWSALVDPRQVAACIPGRPEVEVVDATHFRARVPVGGGFFRTTARIEIGLRDLDEPAQLRADAHGSAMGGGASAEAVAALDEIGPRATRLRWAADVTLSGMAAGFAGMVEGPARSAIGETIACLKARLEAAEAAESAGTAEMPEATGTAEATGAAGSGSTDTPSTGTAG